VSGRVGTLPRVNPFSTRFVEPGAIPYRLPGGTELDELVVRFDATGGWGEIVGPHGSGKSTLLASLLPHVTAWTVHRVRLSTSQRSLPDDLWPLPGPRPLLVIDGFEQLGWLTRRRVTRACRHAGAGLLVTTHRPVGLPPLHRTDVSPAALAWVLARLLPADAGTLLAGFDAAARVRSHRGSLREVLFELYDRWEQTHRSRQ
jgi:energy-coupling factor transporter ATP-binding protein EcfA2